MHHITVTDVSVKALLCQSRGNSEILGKAEMQNQTSVV